MTTNTGSHGAQRLVLRNTLVSLAGQVVGTPLSIIVSAVMARYLGAGDFGDMYVAWQIVIFGFLFVEWGHQGVLPARIAQDRSLAGQLLGSSLAWRLTATVVVYALLALGCIALGYEASFQIVLALVAVHCLLLSLTTAVQDAIRGFERTDVGALGQVGTQLLALLLVVPTVMLGGGLRGVLLAQITGALIVFVLVVRALKVVGVGALSVNAATAKTLMKLGTPFLFFAFAMAAQPNVDAVMLKSLAPPDVVGWHAVARRLVGALIIPASLVIGALYPTLSRLHVQDERGFSETARNALGATALLSVPVALSCALYREIGIAIFSRESYAGAQANLVALSVFLLLIYFSMPLGVAILAAGKQRVWAAVQFGCVIVSAALNPFLIPLFQERMNNGGLGVCVANITSEILMVGAGLVLVKRDVVDRTLLLTLGRSVVAGAAMAGVAYLLRRVNPFIAAPIALSAYLAALWLVGGLGRDQLALFRSALRRKSA